ncbi:hypothetical protein ACFSLT_21800 [Novosphingobium resinovorum]
MWQEEAVGIRSTDGVQIEREAFFRDLAARGVDRVTVVGVAADYCVRWAVEGLLVRGFDVDIPASLTRGSPGMLMPLPRNWAARTACISRHKELFH